jgi:hypothetical protein
MEPDTSLIPSGYRVLVDNPEDGCADERAWVPVALAADAAAAVEIVKAEGVAPEDASVPVVVGRTWERRKRTAEVDCGYFVFGDEPCDQCRGSGRAPCPECSHAGGGCDECYGTGRAGYYSDFEPWEGCGPDDDGAVEFWTVEFKEPEVVDA